MRSPVPLTIERLAAGGDGVGYVNGQVCFVGFSAPGDRLLVTITKRHKKFLRAELFHVIAPGPDRSPAPCPLFERCGGCQWQHLSVDTQQNAKRDILAHALSCPSIPVVSSPSTEGYRSVARLHIGPDDTGAPTVGFMHAGTRRVVPITRCPVLTPELNQALPVIHGLQREAGLETGEFRLALGNNGIVAGLIADAAIPARFYEAARALVPEAFLGVWCRTDAITAVVAGTAMVEITGPDGGAFKAPAESFGQANRAVNQAIADTIRGWLSTRRTKTALELFAGAGNHTVTISRHVETMCASELDPAACNAMADNLRTRGSRHVAVRQGEALDVYSGSGGRAALVVLNPPRVGHHPLAQAIARCHHEAVLYISCNPATLARDLAPLRESGYKLTEATGFDMFPHTPHVECAVLMERGRS